MATRTAELDFPLISELAAVVSTPLVLHGSSGVSDSDLQKAVQAGMKKINIATHLNHIFTEALRAKLESDPKLIDTRKYIAPARTAMRTEVSRLLQLLAQ